MDHSGDDGNDVQPENKPISFSVKDYAITGPNVPLPMMKRYNKKGRRMDHSSANNDDDVKPENYPISFSLKDLPITGPNAPLPMVIKLQINNLSVLRVVVNEGSAANILYWSAFLNMRLPESMLKQCENAFLKDVIGNGAPVKGYIDLDTTFGKGGNAKMIKLRYFVVDSPSVYNVVIDRRTVADLGAVISTLHLTMKYPIGDDMVGVVKADLEMAKRCYDMGPNAIY
ncbi:uncharacterized protein LOC123904143 [Trifolium pratense]|uniref:uncharacterized protein LOC123904143 n=1 Tax=Trifolium pratense TaxID=57577 RepID=UPI001E697F25|nr:uncharacterized protein LOC123904143 [Trifolium pratense]